MCALNIKVLWERGNLLWSSSDIAPIRGKKFLQRTHPSRSYRGVPCRYCLHFLFQFLFHYFTEMFVVKVTNVFQFATPKDHLSALITSSQQHFYWRLILSRKSFFSAFVCCHPLLTVLSSIQTFPFSLWSVQSRLPRVHRKNTLCSLLSFKYLL